MRKIVLCITCILTVITCTLLQFNKNSAQASGQAEIAMELTTETVLHEGNADARLPMASTTKILTAIIIIEDCDLDETIRVPDEAVGVEGSSIYLKKDEEIDIRDLLYGLMLRSGNDSAAALAIHHSGSIEEFAKIMTERACKIGATNSNFTNPSGLPDSRHYTTARDLCKIACYAMRNDTFERIVSTANYTGKYRSFTNKNKMLRLCEGANGVKTGYTLKAGRCLVSSAVRDGMDVVCVVLNCPDMYERSCAIFDGCFKNFKLLKLGADKVFMCNKVPCKLKESEYAVIKTTDNLSFEAVLMQNENSDASDGAIGELKIYSGNNLLFSKKLYSI